MTPTVELEMGMVPIVILTMELLAEEDVSCVVVLYLVELKPSDEVSSGLDYYMYMHGHFKT